MIARNQELWQVIKPFYHNQVTPVTRVTVMLDVVEDKVSSIIRCVYPEGEYPYGGISELTAEDTQRLYNELQKVIALPKRVHYMKLELDMTEVLPKLTLGLYPEVKEEPQPTKVKLTPVPLDADVYYLQAPKLTSGQLVSLRKQWEAMNEVTPVRKALVMIPDDMQLQAMPIEALKRHIERLTEIVKEREQA